MCLHALSQKLIKKQASDSQMAKAVSGVSDFGGGSVYLVIREIAKIRTIKLNEA